VLEASDKRGHLFVAGGGSLPSFSPIKKPQRASAVDLQPA